MVVAVVAVSVFWLRVMEKLSAVGSVEEPYTMELVSFVISTLLMPDVELEVSPTVTAVTTSVPEFVRNVNASLEVAVASGAIVTFPGFVPSARVVIGIAAPVTIAGYLQAELLAQGVVPVA